MIAKEVAARKGPGSFSGLVTYLLAARGKDERVGHVQATNCFGADAESAVLEVLNTQGYNQRARDKSYHLILSFREAEISPEVLHAIEDRACDALGFGGHQRLSVVHHDTDHLHVHVAINRVHPTRHTVHCPSFSKLALDKACAQLEADYGLVADRHRINGREHVVGAAEALRDRLRVIAPELDTARSWSELHETARSHGVELKLRGAGLVFVEAEGATVRASSLSRRLSKATLERRLGPFEGEVSSVEPQRGARRAPDSERLSGEGTLIGGVQRRCGAELSAATGWQELHEVARAHGLTLKARGNGLVFVDARGRAIKASSVSRNLSKPALERRFGSPFEPAPHADRPQTSGLAYERQPEGRGMTPALYARYATERDQTRLARTEALQRLRTEHARERAALRNSTKRRWAAAKLMMRGPMSAKIWSLNVKLANRRDCERLRQRHREALRAVAERHRSDGWLGWLQRQARQGDMEALTVLRARASRREPSRNSVLAPALTAVLNEQIEGIELRSVMPTGTLIYRVPNATVRDDGTQLCLSEVSAPAAEALLKIARAQYGRRIGVRGNDAFRIELVRAAIRSRVDIEFADPSLEGQRQQLQRREPPRGQQQEHRPESEPGSARPGDEHADGVEGGRRAIHAARGSRPAVQRLLESRPFHAGPQTPARPQSRVRDVSEIHVVGDRQEAAMLLPPHARRDVDERRSRADPVLRRHSGGATVSPPPKRRAWRR